MSILNVKNVPIEDDSITNMQYHTYNPYTTSFSHNDEIRIAIQQQDLYIYPAESFIYLECQVTNRPVIADAEAIRTPKFVNNCASFLFDEIRYELNGFEIDKCKNPGITTTLKGLASYTSNDLYKLQMAGWNLDSNETANDGVYNFIIPLKMLFGFAEDYNQIIINSKHELIITRNRSDVNVFVGNSNNTEIKISKIQWYIPHVQVSDATKLQLLRYVDKKAPIQLHYRSWELFEYPILPQTDKHIWSVKTSSHVNKPRYIILALQTDKRNQAAADGSHFDHCDVSDVKVTLNSEVYPYENLNLNFGANIYAVLYDMFLRFMSSYYNDRTITTPLLDLKTFKEKGTLYVFDCSRQNETLKHGIVDLRINIQSRVNFPSNTTAYCLVIHDNVVIYNPYTNIVNKSF